MEIQLQLEQQKTHPGYEIFIILGAMWSVLLDQVQQLLGSFVTAYSSNFCYYAL